MHVDDPQESDLDSPEEEFWSGTGGEVDKCSVLLRFFGDDLEPNKISALLGVQATSANRKGDQIVRASGLIYTVPTGRWLLDSGTTRDTIDHQIALLFANLTDDLPAWDKLATSFSAELKCHLILRRWTRYTMLAAETVQAIAARRLRLHLEIYASWDFSPFCSAK
jgi:hypothetical protein